MLALGGGPPDDGPADEADLEESDVLLPGCIHEGGHAAEHRPWLRSWGLAAAVLAVVGGLFAAAAACADRWGTRGLQQAGPLAHVIEKQELATCTDVQTHCPYWAENGYCQSHPNFMQAECCSSCCRDKQEHCSFWANSGYCHTHTDFMRRECCDSCRGGGPCEDFSEHCEYWFRSGMCETHKEFMEQRCCKSCSGGGPCVDKSEHCPHWERNGKCYTHREYMREHCCKSCGYGDPPKDDTDGGGGGSGGGSEGAHCKALSVQTPMEHALNIVLVPSAFRGDLRKWEEQAKAMNGEFSQYAPFDAERIPSLNVWYVDIETQDDDGQHCHFGCHGIERLLCCPGATKLLAHARYHCGSGMLTAILVIHNSDTYGGAGMPDRSAASCSTHPLSAKIAVHEMGHSLFGLGDEYTVGRGNPNEDPNCDNAGCPKWQDLLGRHGVGCVPRKCQDGRYFASGDTLMADFSWDFGAANERIMCCKYLFHTRTVPGFCEKFNQGGLDLGHYCSRDLWKGRYTNLITSGGIGVATASTEEQSDLLMGTPKVRLESPVEWEIERNSDGGWTCVQSPEELKPGIYLKGDVEGDPTASEENSVSVEVFDAAGTYKRTVTIRTDVSVEVPPDLSGGFGQERVTIPQESISIILEEGERCSIHAE